MKKNEPVDFSKFGKHFQESLVQLILFDRAFANQIQEVLDIQYLEYKYLQEFTQLILDYKRSTIYTLPYQSCRALLIQNMIMIAKH